MTFRGAILAAQETCWWLVASLAWVGWAVITAATCGAVGRRRRPKVHAVAIAHAPQLTANVLVVGSNSGDLASSPSSGSSAGVALRAEARPIEASA
jgi:hypothetical protein